MRLLWVSVHGFKAYKNPIKVELHPGANAIIGLNGSGKSSLLEAITLVVSEIYGRRVVDVKSVFHHGVRNASLSATIELCFDNRDRRLAMYDMDEVILSRKFISGGPQTRKDQFLVMGKAVTKQEFAGLLENGGFSKTNPYYVIRQGKIMEMATMTDEGRMKLLKDFSGVQVYEDKRNQALNTLQLAQQKAKDADILIQNLEMRLSELQEQHKEVCEYENLIRLSDVYRVVVKDLDLSNLEDQIMNIDQEIETIESELLSSIDNVEGEKEKIQSEREQIRNYEKLVEEYRDKLESCIIKYRNNNDRIRLLKQSIERDNNLKITYQKKVKKLQENIKKSTQDLTIKNNRLKNELLPDMSKLDQKEKLLDIENTQINLDKQKINSKIERCEFKSPQDRNQLIKNQIQLFQSKIDQEKSTINQLNQQLQKFQKSINNDLTQENIVQQISDIEQEQFQLTTQASHLQRKKNDLIRQETILQDELRNLNKPSNRPKLEAISNLQRACRWSTWKGNMTALAWAFGGNGAHNGGRIGTNRRPPGRGGDSSVGDNVGVYDELLILEKLIEKIQSWRDIDFDLSQPRSETDPLIFGPLWSLLDVPSICRKATSQAIGPQMDNLVVWDDEVASNIYEEIKKNQGSTTITPLSQIIKRSSSRRIPRYPKNTLTDTKLIELSLNQINNHLSQDVNNINKDINTWSLLSSTLFSKCDAIPLSLLIKCPNFIRPAIECITNRWLVCKNLDIGRKICNNTEFDCVTLQGDKVTYKGSVQGGHISSMNDILTLVEEFLKILKQDHLKNEKLFSLQNSINHLVVERSSLNNQLHSIQDQLHILDQNKIKFETNLNSISTIREDTINQINKIHHEIELSKTNLSSFENNLIDLKKNQNQEQEKLTKQDKDLITSLSKRQEKINLEISLIKDKYQDLQRLHKRIIVDIMDLETAIKKDKQEIVQLQSDLPDDDEIKQHQAQLEETQILCEEAAEAEQTAKNDLKRGENDLRKISNKIENAQETLETLNNRVDTLTQAKEFAVKRKQTLELKKAQQLSERQNVIIQAGQTDEEVQKLKQLPPKQLRQMLHDVEVKLSKAPRVNQKALADLITFQNELQNKIAHRTELLDGLRSVQELMHALDERRSRTLRNQFDKVNANLQIVFGKIVPGGRAKLVIKKLSEEKIEALRQARRSMQLALTDQTPSPASDATQSQAWKLELGPPGPEFSGDVLHWDEVASGIEVKASFRPASDPNVPTEYFPLVALSGGQKTIVALSLIFAMQRCDKAPFYVLDEADAALDEAYRSAVAKLIQESARDSQFLITTFRRELCEICDRHFHVTNIDRVAHVDVSDVQTALRVILEDAEKSAAAVALEQGTDQ